MRTEKEYTTQTYIGLAGMWAFNIPMWLIDNDLVFYSLCVLWVLSAILFTAGWYLRRKLRKVDSYHYKKLIKEFRRQGRSGPSSSDRDLIG